jgi:hypothetical protein
MGLRIPSDLAEWHRWQRRRHLAREVKHRLVGARNAGEPRATIVHGSPEADIVVLVDATHASMANAVLAPLKWLPPERVITVLGPGVTLDVAGATQVVGVSDLGTHLRSARTLLGCGEYTDIGAAAWSWARKAEAHTFVSQHGALTPFAPPLPRAAHLLAWSDRDGAFWTSGRQDVAVTATGSQLLWRAGEGLVTGARAPSSTNGDADSGGRGPLTYLGQGHAAEISRARLVHAALATCREHGAVYRPHPSERDVTSRAVLAAYARAGIAVDTSGVPLVDLEAPIVSVFSTGVLEAAARGRDAWVDFPRPPAWLGEFWERYAMHRLGTLPTPPPDWPEQEPARRIAEIVGGAAS